MVYMNAQGNYVLSTQQKKKKQRRMACQVAERAAYTRDVPAGWWQYAGGHNQVENASMQGFFSCQTLAPITAETIVNLKKGRKHELET